MNIVEQILDKEGPCGSSKVVGELVKRHGLSREAARQRVSRGTKNISSLDHIRLARGEKFIYLTKDFGSPYYWKNLIKSLQEVNSVYGLALAALKQRDGIIPRHHFSIACGSPIKQKKHISAESVLKGLINAKLVERYEVKGFGDCVVIIHRERSYYADKVAKLRARVFTENILLEGVSSWLKNLGLVSYNKVVIRNDSDKTQPKVGTFHWDLTAPSYLGALLNNKRGASLPGFIACDICLEKMTLEGVEPFINKCNSTRALKNMGRCLQIIVANGYTEDAFASLKAKGVVPATITNLFGKDVAEGVNYLIRALTGLAHLVFDPEQFDEMFARLSKVEGAVANMRGAFFEIIVAEALRPHYPDVRLNYDCKTNNGQKAEIDVTAIKTGAEIRFIECKGYAPYAEIPDSEVELWLTKRVPRIVAMANEHADWKNLVPICEFWTIGKLSDKSIQRLERMKEKVKPTRYKLIYKELDDVISEVRKSCNKGLVKSFEANFVKNPTSHQYLKYPTIDTATL
jgi:hypothetical protein